MARVGARDGPEQAVGESAKHAGHDEEGIIGGDRRADVRDREEHEHGQEQVLAIDAACESRQWCCREHHRAGEDRDEEAHLGFGDVEAGGDLR